MRRENRGCVSRETLGRARGDRDRGGSTILISVARIAVARGRLGHELHRCSQSRRGEHQPAFAPLAPQVDARSWSGPYRCRHRRRHVNACMRTPNGEPPGGLSACGKEERCARGAPREPLETGHVAELVVCAVALERSIPRAGARSKDLSRLGSLARSAAFHVKQVSSSSRRAHPRGTDLRVPRAPSRYERGHDRPACGCACGRRDLPARHRDAERLCP